MTEKYRGVCSPLARKEHDKSYRLELLRSPSSLSLHQTHLEQPQSEIVEISAKSHSVVA